MADAAGYGFGDRPPSVRRRRVPMGYQVILGVSGLLTLIIAVTLVAVFLVVGVAHAAQAGERNTPYGNAIDAAALNAKGVANDERGYLLTGDRTFLGEAHQRIGIAQAAFAAAVTAAHSAAERSSARDAQTGFGLWVEAVRAGFIRAQAGHRAAVVAASVGPNRALRKRYEASLARADTLSRSAQQSAETSLSKRSNRSLTILLICLAIALGIGIRIAFWLVRSVALPVYRVLSLLHFDGPADLPST